MATCAYLHTSRSFEAALHAYKEYLNLPFEFEKFDNSKEYSLANGDFFLLHNSIPENLKTLDILQKLHLKPALSTIPIIFVSEELCPESEPLFQEVEFVWKASIPFHSGDFFKLIEELEEYYETKLTLMSKITKIRVALGKLDFENAEKLFHQIKGKYPHEFRKLLLESEIYSGKKQWPQSIEALNKAKEILPGSLEVDTLLAKTYLAMGDNANYEAIMESMTQKAELHLKNMIHWGNVYMERGESKKSQTAFERALEEDPKDIEARQGLLASSLINGKTEVAQEVIDGSPQALQLARLCNMKGIAMANKGQYRSAEKLYNNAIKFLPDSGVAHKLWLNLGLCMKKSGDLDKALKMFTKAHKLAPEDYDRARIQVEDVKEAIKIKREKKLAELEKKAKSSITLNYGSGYLKTG